jgi:hypothetical protein
MAPRHCSNERLHPGPGTEATSQPPFACIWPLVTIAPTGRSAQLIHRRTRSIPFAYLRINQWESFGFSREPAGIGAGSHANYPRHALPGGDGGPRPHGRAPGLAHGIRLTGKELASSISSPSPPMITASATTWSPAWSTVTSSKTTSETATSWTWPSRSTLARGASRTASRSSNLLARYSWTTPTTALHVEGFSVPFGVLLQGIKRVCTMCTPWASVRVVLGPVRAGLRMFAGIGGFARAGMQFESHLGHAFPLVRGVDALMCVH